MSTEAPEVILRLTRPPVTKDELWELVYTMFGVAIPRQQVCPDHQAPFDAFADGYFGNPSNWALWYGSRGTGKSYMLALLGLVKAAVLDTQVTLLGGSMAQSINVQEHVVSLMQAPLAPRYAVTAEKQTELSLTRAQEGGFDSWIRPLPASQKTVRGPHPHTTLLDEIDEMEKKVYDAAMGQALNKENSHGIRVPEMVVASSTWQNPIGTFQEVRDEALAKGRPTFTWCYREVLRTPDNPTGWMDPDFIRRKKDAVPEEMFRVEYELGEPAGDARAFDLAKVKAFFLDIEPIEHIKRGNLEEWVFAEPDPLGEYAAGADWAKAQDFTVILICRTDVRPRQLVFARRVNRVDWPTIINGFNEVVDRYHARSGHDATGMGSVIADLVHDRSLKVEMVDRKRSALLNEYIVDFEHGLYRFPRCVTPLYHSHQAATVDDVWGTQRVLNSHLPDEVAAAAIMHRAAERAAPPAGPRGVPKSGDYPKALAPLLEQTERVDGVVKRKDPERETWTGLSTGRRAVVEEQGEAGSGVITF